MTNQDLFTTAQEQRVKELAVKAIDESVSQTAHSKFPGDWIIALEFIKKFHWELRNSNVGDPVELFKYLIG